MAVYKNKSDQKVAIFAVDDTGMPLAGDAANINAQISLDGAASDAVEDTNPAELDGTNHPGIYIFDLTQEETDADLIIISSASSTEGVTIRPVIIYTESEIRDANTSKVNGSSTAASKLALSADSMLPGTIDTTSFAATTTQFEAADITEATADHYNGRIIIFTSGNLVKQATTIQDYSLISGRGHFTVVGLTEAPDNNDTFMII